jgi:hypothetical protein
MDGWLLRSIATEGRPSRSRRSLLPTPCAALVEAALRLLANSDERKAAEQEPLLGLGSFE